LIDLVITSS